MLWLSCRGGGMGVAAVWDGRRKVWWQCCGGECMRVLMVRLFVAIGSSAALLLLPVLLLLPAAACRAFACCPVPSRAYALPVLTSALARFRLAVQLCRLAV